MNSVFDDIMASLNELKERAGIDMEEEKKIPKLLDEREVLLAAHTVMGDVMEWGLENAESEHEAMNYIFGIHDLVTQLLREING